MADSQANRCPECQPDDRSGDFSRRDFIRTIGGSAALAAGVVPAWATARAALTKSTPVEPAETAVKRLYDSLSPEQRDVVCFSADHKLREKYGANWAITKPTIRDFFSKDQQQTIRDIFRGITSEDGYERFVKQMADDSGGFDRYHVAIFGKPGEGNFEWVMSGRHLTVRCDGNLEDGTAFGGPIVYGHGAGDSKPGLPGNVFFYQTQRVNEVFRMLDGKQRDVALVSRAPSESSVEVRPTGPFPGIAIRELSSDQKELVQKVMHELLAPYREADVREAIGCVTAAGGLDQIHLAFYQQGDIGDDEVWDIWRLEGPSFVWHFRGSPHVHAYINIAKKSSS